MRQKWQIIAVAVVSAGGLALVAWAWSTANYPVRNAPAAGKKIVAFGDDLISGTHVPPGQNFVSALERRLQRPIVNAGKSGDTTATALARLDEMLEREKPDLVLVLLGKNDAPAGIAESQTLANLSAIIGQAQNRGAAVLLFGAPDGLDAGSYRRLYARISRRTRAAYLPNLLDSVWGNAQLMADKTRVNHVGYRVMADRAWPVIEELLANPTASH